MKRAKVAKDRAVEEYREAVYAARQAGLSMPKIAEAAGISKQAVEQILLRHSS